MCGCGQRTGISKTTDASRVAGEHVKYVRGHQPKKAVDPQQPCGPWFNSAQGRWYISGRKRGSVVAWARVVLEDKLGRPLETREEAHHINGNKTDDRPENLECLTKSAHAELHGADGIHNQFGYWPRKNVA